VSITVLGNGESRRHIDISKFTGTIIGCNAVHRDIVIDHLVCCDRRMVEEAVKNPCIKDTLIYTRKDWLDYFYSKNQNVKLLPDLPYQGDDRKDQTMHWGSGPYAVLLAAQLCSKEVSLYGFDLYSKSKSVNNIYKGTNNYSSPESKPVDPSYWIYQIGKVFEYFSDCKFKIHNTRDWSLPVEWQKNNVRFVDL